MFSDISISLYLYFFTKQKGLRKNTFLPNVMIFKMLPMFLPVHVSRSKKLKKEENSLFGGTPDTSSRHPCVPRHPGWEPLP